MTIEERIERLEKVVSDGFAAMADAFSAMDSRFDKQDDKFDAVLEIVQQIKEQVFDLNARK